MKPFLPVRFRAYAAIIPSMIFFALSFVWFKIANISYGPLTIVFLRLAISVVLLLAFGCITRQLVLPRRGDLGKLMLLGFFEPFLYFVFESYGLQRLSSTVGAVIISTIPLVSPFAAYLFLRERFHWLHITCVVVSFVGVGLVVIEGGRMMASWSGVLLQFGAVFAAVGYTVVLQKMPWRLNILSLILYQNIVGSVLFLPLWLFGEAEQFIALPIDVAGLVAIIKLSVVVSTVAFLLFSYSVRQLGVNRANMFVNMIPIFTAFFAWHILGDTLTVQKVIGIIIVVVGLFLAERLRRPEGSHPTLGTV